jgi:hypothetical protein
MGKTTHDKEDLILTTKRKLIPSVQRKAPSISPDESDPEGDLIARPTKKVKKTTKKKTKPAKISTKAAKAKGVPASSDSEIEVVSGGVVIECVFVRCFADASTNNS